MDTDEARTTGPLAGLKVVEIAALAPVTFAGMVLSDLGADVLRIERGVRSGDGSLCAAEPPTTRILERGRTSLAVDLKHQEGVGLVLAAVEAADVFIEGFRPRVTERLGLGPDRCHAINRGLVYGRMTGWGQDGPLASTAGHDINYIAIAGALGLVGEPGGRPVPPANIVGDFAGGGMLLVVGILAALNERQRSGLGQVVDASMVDGAALLTAFIHGLADDGDWTMNRGENILDGGSPIYSSYETKDGQWVCVGAIEPQFQAELARVLGLDRSGGSEMTSDQLRAAFATRTRAEWEARFDGLDACFAPVLSLEEASYHRHNVARGTFAEIDGRLQPMPAPRFGRSRCGRPAPPGTSTSLEAASGWGLSADLVAAAVAANAACPGLSGDPRRTSEIA